MNSLDQKTESFAQVSLRRLKWWILLGIVGGMATPVVEGGDFWMIKLRQIVFTTGISLIGWLAFVGAQSGWNRSDRRWLMWLNAIVSWFIVKAAVTLIWS